ncbi:deoxyribonuclease I [Rhodopirellula sp.]|nr:deoxyribonuclease I [Rhodopirellula sp.]MDB4679054.1 deoxyribonuclease I [Rhodopirellula sp.]
MSDSDRGHPIQAALIVLLLIGGGWYFVRHYEVAGLGDLIIIPKTESDDAAMFASYQDSSLAATTASELISQTRDAPNDASIFNSGVAISPGGLVPGTLGSRPALTNLKIASWALDGFGPTKLSNSLARQNLAKVIRRFDIVALQQIASIERDLIPRLVDAINHGETRYDFVLGEPTGPKDRPEQLAFIFDTSRVRVDRRQTYTVQDPTNRLTYDPLVAWFRAAEPLANLAWTFSLVNVRIDLGNAPSEVALLPEVMRSIREDGRGEDDVVLAGLFQADDSYLVPALGGDSILTAVRGRATDVFGKYQTSNLLLDTRHTTECIGRGGVLDYPRLFDLNQTEAESVSGQLPVYAEFAAMEGI